MTQDTKATITTPIVLAAGEGERLWFLRSAFTFKASTTSTAGAICLIEALVPAGFAPPLHIHHDEDEALYVLEGALEIVCGAERHTAEVGGFAFLPRGVPHAFRVLGEEPVRMLSLTIPDGGQEAFFREAGRAALGPGLPPPARPEIASLAEIAARHGHEIVGPFPAGREKSTAGPCEGQTCGDVRPEQ